MIPIPTRKTRLVVASLCCLVAAGCQDVAPLAEYRPIVDPGRVDVASYETDLSECRNLALNVESEYRQRRQQELGQNLAAGIVAGAITGAIVGNNTYGGHHQPNFITYGALAGAAAGVEAGDYTSDFVRYGPRRVVDRCMNNRGHELLNDIGRA